MPGSAWDMAADLSRWEERGTADGQESAHADPPRGGRARRRVETVALVIVALLGISVSAAAIASSGSSAGPRQAGAASRGQAPALARISPVALATQGPVVVLGDSVAAGSLVPKSPVGSPAGCLRSTHSYAADVAAALHARTFIDAACSGATYAAMTQSQKTTLGGTNPPQFSALARNDSIVMISVGADDAGGYGHIMGTCSLLSLTGPSGAPCARHYGGSLAGKITADAPRIAAVLRGIRARAPRARVLVVGYPAVFPNSGKGCWPAVPLASGDIGFLRGLEIDLNHMLATEAAATGVTYVNTYTPTIGHDICQREGVRDVEGLLPGSLTEPFHPNARGHSAMAAQVLRALG